MARIYNGTSDLVSNTDGVALTAYPLTLTAWVKRAAAIGTREWIGGPVTIGDSNHRIGLTFEAGNQAGADARASSDNVGASTATVTDTNWHFIVGRFATTSSRFCVLDTVVGTENTSGSGVNFATMNDFRIGASGSGVTELFFAGKVYDFAVFDYVVTDPDVSSLFTNAKTPLTLTTPATHFWAGASLTDTGSVGGITLTASGTTTDADAPFAAAVALLLPMTFQPMRTILRL